MDLKNLKYIINEDLKRYSKRLCVNKLNINVNKTIYMIIAQRLKKKTDLVLKIGDSKLSEIDKYKYLGLHINNNLDWAEHINVVTRKISSIAGVMRTCSGYICDAVKKMIYHCYIENIIRYFIPCWGSAAESHLIDYNEHRIKLYHT